VPAALLIGIHLALALHARAFAHIANGTLTYLPALILMLLLGIYHARRQPMERWTLLIATGVFVLAFTFRAVDRAVCPFFPIGTHFIWHLLIALVAYLALRVLIMTRLNRGLNT
jgi:hypothetical protein